MVAFLELWAGHRGGRGVTITIGEVTDTSRSRLQQLFAPRYALVDLVRYYNDEGFMPGGKTEGGEWRHAFGPCQDYIRL
jgi:hypothetical protein